MPRLGKINIWPLLRTEFGSVYAYITEKEFQATVRELAEAYGWTVFCTWRSKHSPAGEPDLRMIRPPRYLCVGLGYARKVLSAKQPL